MLPVASASAPQPAPSGSVAPPVRPQVRGHQGSFAARAAAFQANDGQEKKGAAPGPERNTSVLRMAAALQSQIAGPAQPHRAPAPVVAARPMPQMARPREEGARLGFAARFNTFSGDKALVRETQNPGSARVSIVAERVTAFQRQAEAARENPKPKQQPAEPNKGFRVSMMATRGGAVAPQLIAPQPACGGAGGASFAVRMSTFAKPKPAPVIVQADAPTKEST